MKLHYSICLLASFGGPLITASHYLPTAACSDTILTVIREVSVRKASVLSNIPAICMTRFAHDFPEAEKSVWSESSGCYRVVFERSGLYSKAIYDCSGALNYAITEYPMRKMPSFLLRDVAKTYPGYSIVSGKEIIAHQERAFHIVIENNSSYLFLKLTNSKTEKIRSLSKG